MEIEIIHITTRSTLTQPLFKLLPWPYYYALNTDILIPNCLLWDCLVFAKCINGNVITQRKWLICLTAKSSIAVWYLQLNQDKICVQGRSPRPWSEMYSHKQKARINRIFNVMLVRQANQQFRFPFLSHVSGSFALLRSVIISCKLDLC